MRLFLLLGGYDPNKAEEVEAGVREGLRDVIKRLLLGRIVRGSKCCEL